MNTQNQSKNTALVGKNFYKVGPGQLVEKLYVLEHDTEGRRYLVAFAASSPTEGDTECLGVGRIKGNISWVQEFVLESYAEQDQKLVAKLLKAEKRCCEIGREVMAELHPEDQDVPF